MGKNSRRIENAEPNHEKTGQTTPAVNAVEIDMSVSLSGADSITTACELLPLLTNRFLPACEHTALALSKTAFLTGSGAKSGALDAPRKIQDPDLYQITATWPTLPEHVKSAILKMVKEADK